MHSSVSFGYGVSEIFDFFLTLFTFLIVRAFVVVTLAFNAVAFQFFLLFMFIFLLLLIAFFLFFLFFLYFLFDCLLSLSIV